MTTDVPRGEHERHDRRAALIPEPDELVARNGAPDTIAGWQALADGLLSDPCCAFHRNVQISSRYAWIYQLQPACFKWAAIAESRRTTSGSLSSRSGWTLTALVLWTSRTAWAAGNCC